MEERGIKMKRKIETHCGGGDLGYACFLWISILPTTLGSLLLKSLLNIKAVAEIGELFQN